MQHILNSHRFNAENVLLFCLFFISYPTHCNSFVSIGELNWAQQHHTQAATMHMSRKKNEEQKIAANNQIRYEKFIARSQHG